MVTPELLRILFTSVLVMVSFGVVVASAAAFLVLLGLEVALVFSFYRSSR
jgi:hypothetical protein